MQQISSYLFFKKPQIRFLVFGLLVAVAVSIFTFEVELMAPVIVLFSAISVVYVIFLFRNPKIGIATLIVYCFLLGFLVREAGVIGVPYGIGVEIFLILTWVSALLYYKKHEWAVINNDLSFLFLVWFLICILEVANPAGASVIGWLQETRSAGLYPALIVPLVQVVFNKKEDLDFSLKLLLAVALIAALNGIKQVHIGLWPGEQAFLDDGGAATHILFGKLRAFSFYDAGQFGAFEAVFIVIAVVLALGSSKVWKMALLFSLAGIYAYAMLLSGTRGAFFALVVAAFFAILLSKNYRILILGGIFMLCFLGMLKFTTIGNGNYDIYRFRTALDPEDASLNVRFDTQRILKEYLSSRPFGGGMGVLGASSVYNKDKFLSTIQPDSYWVKLWAMCGIVGLTIWFSMMMYLLGKCCSIVWQIQDKKLKVKLIALFSATIGIFFCSYGNEVINNMPSSLVVCISLAFIYISPRFDRAIANENLLSKLKSEEEPEGSFITIKNQLRAGRDVADMDLARIAAAK